jgi:hypothetical protein
MLAILNVTLAVINNNERFAIHCTGASLTCWQVKDQSLLAQFGVTLGEVQHGGGVV